MACIQNPNLNTTSRKIIAMNNALTFRLDSGYYSIDFAMAKCKKVSISKITMPEYRLSY